MMMVMAMLLMIIMKVKRIMMTFILTRVLKIYQ